MVQIEKSTSEGMILQWVARARSNNNRHTIMTAIQIEADGDGFVAIATDGRRMHIATTDTDLPIGTWNYSETKESIVLTESDLEFCNWRRVVPENTKNIGNYKAHKYTKKSSGQFSMALFKLARETQATVNLIYLSDIADKNSSDWNVHMTKTTEGTNDVRKAITLTADNPFHSSDRKAVIMPMQLT